VHMDAVVQVLLECLGYESLKPDRRGMKPAHVREPHTLQGCFLL